MDITKSKLYESAFIKSIRRGLVDDAIYWGVLLCKLGKTDIVWRRMFIHLSEDVGVADRNLPASIAALYVNWNFLKEGTLASYETPGTERLPYVHAIMLLATAYKSRAVDNAIAVHFNTDEDREVPDYAYDLHSPLGKRMGRDVAHFFEEAGKIEREIGLDEWKDKAKQIMLKKQT